MIFSDLIDTPIKKNRKKIIAVELIILSIILSLHAILLNTYFVPIFFGVDPNGYHVSGKIFSEKSNFSFTPYDSASFVGRMWVINEEGKAYPKYPPFYPLLCGIMIRFFGEYSDLYINYYLSIASVFLIYLLSRLLGLSSWALLTALNLSLNPVCNYYGIRQVSHPSSLFFVLLGFTLFFFSLRIQKLFSKSILFFLSGVIIAFSSGIRYTDFLLAFPPYFILLFLNKRKFFFIILYTLGLIIPFAILAYYHYNAFGHPLKTGYSLTEEQYGFSLLYFVENIRFYILGLLNDGLGPSLILFLFGFILITKTSLISSLFFASWIFPTFFLYASYYWAPEKNYNGFLRFLIPSFIPAIILSIYFIKNIIAKLIGDKIFFKILFVIVFILINSCWGLFLYIENSEQEFKRAIKQKIAIDFILSKIEAGSVIIASKDLLNYLDYEQKYILYTEEIFNQQKLKNLIERVNTDEPTGLQKKRAKELENFFINVSQREYREKLDKLIKEHLNKGRKIFFVFLSNNKKRLPQKLPIKYYLKEVAEKRTIIPPYKFLPPIKLKNLEKENKIESLIITIMQLE